MFIYTLGDVIGFAIVAIFLILFGGCYVVEWVQSKLSRFRKPKTESPSSQEFDVRQVDVLSAGSMVKTGAANQTGPSKVISVTIGERSELRYRLLNHDGVGCMNASDAEITEVISRPDIEMTLTIRTPKGN